MNQDVDFNRYNNDWYRKKIGASKLKQLFWYLINVMFFINPLNIFSGLKIAFLKSFGAKIGEKVVLKPGINIKYPWLLEIGDNCWIGENVWIDNLTSVVLGKNVCLSQGAMLLTGNHNYLKTSFDLIVKGIILHDGVWIGAKAVVCPGVVCGSHAVLAVASVATSDLESYKIYQGNPAKEVRTREITA
ncbi:MAG: WcaF family extracellular polysaccharide biosynthesis acetyltransferase [Chitinophagaceae bacterium]